MFSSAVSSELAETSGTQIHTSTVQGRLARSGLPRRVPPKNLYLHQGQATQLCMKTQELGFGEMAAIALD